MYKKKIIVFNKSRSLLKEPQTITQNFKEKEPKLWL